MFVKEVALLDPVFFVNKKRAMLILNLFAELCPSIKFEIQTKIEHLDDDIINAVAKLNIVLECGIQTLDERVQKAIKRRNNKRKIIRNLSKLKERKIKFETHLIYGLPYQSIASFMSDYNLLKNYTDNIRIFPLSRLKGTDLDLSLNEEKYIFSPIFPNEIIQSKWMSGDTILKLKQFGA